MMILNTNLRKTTREAHNPIRTYTLTPRGGLKKLIEVKMPVDRRDVPTLWQ